MLLVQCDFDDTIIENNVSKLLRSRFLPGLWRRMDADYEAGLYSVEESNTRQFALVRTDPETLERMAVSGAILRPGFPDFVAHCAVEGIELAVVSSGLDAYVGPVLRNLGIPAEAVHAAHARVAADGIHVRYVDPTGLPVTRGFKDSYVAHFKGQGKTVVYVGDGWSDVGPARRADYVIARSNLRRRLEAHGTPCRPFCDFHDVARHVDDIRRGLDLGGRVA